jgi:serine/threonine protein kinase/formylglycine-generating enzyme required for sulfatase activity
MIGQTLGHYRVEQKLGEGGMGVVYRARDLHLDRPVAIKVLPPERTADAERKRRFIQEAKAASALNHPNIITIHDIDTDGDFMVMEYVEGWSLDRLIGSGALGVEQALGCAVQIAAALAAAHAAGIVHRDIKPANIMVTDAGHVKVLDFGLAKLSEHLAGDPEASTRTAATLTKEGVVVGTVAYMSPEQAQGKAVDPRTDVFSCGVVLYEMLAGQRPFQGDSQLSILSAILSERPAPRLGKAPSEVGKVVARSLEKDRERRYPSAAELCKDLVTCQKRLASPGLRGQLRKPKVAVPALALLVAVLATATWFIIRHRHQSWARNVALPEIARLIEKENFDAAFRLGRQAERHIPDDPELRRLQQRYAVPASFRSTPPGADVYVKGYLNLEASWIHLGKTPLENTPVPASHNRWKVAKEGFGPVEGGFHAHIPRPPFTLHPAAEAPPEMVFVPGGDSQGVGRIMTDRGLPVVKLDDFWLDKYEVANKQYQQFVDQGGYQKREYWKHSFVKDGKVLSWEQAMAEFRDRTGRPGPSTWELGRHPAGQDDFPVSGVSWYEAAAYAEFAGKGLPSAYHWYRAAEMMQFVHILWASNFSGQGPARVGSHAGLGAFGTYDMAGNVREWCWNRAVGPLAGDWRYILGGSWKEALYTFQRPNAANPMDRSAINGFRCAKYPTPLADAVTRPIESVFRDYSQEKPVSDEIFQIYRSFYSYERTDLQATAEAVDDKSPHWRREKVTFQAAYGNERMIAHLFLPRNAVPPYQTVIYSPSGLANTTTSSEQLEMPLVDFLPRIGRALLYPVYQDTYERRRNPSVPSRRSGADRRDGIIQRSKDFSRSIDYLATRPDIDLEKLAYYSYSSVIVPIFPAIDGRIKASFHIGVGLPQRRDPPEVDPLNFAPRAKHPILIIGGRHDFLQTVEGSQMPLLRLMGAPEKDKRLALFETGHVVWPGPEVIKEILTWLDRYLGPVKMK